MLKERAKRKSIKAFVSSITFGYAPDLQLSNSLTHRMEKDFCNQDGLSNLTVPCSVVGNNQETLEKKELGWGVGEGGRINSGLQLMAGFFVLIRKAQRTFRRSNSQRFHSPVTQHPWAGTGQKRVCMCLTQREGRGSKRDCVCVCARANVPACVRDRDPHQPPNTSCWLLKGYCI